MKIPRCWKTSLAETGILYFFLISPQILFLVSSLGFDFLNPLSVVGAPSILEVVAKVVGLQLISFFLVWTYLAFLAPPLFLFSGFVFLVTYVHLMVLTPSLLQVYFPQILLKVLPWCFPWVEKVLIGVGLFVLYRKTAGGTAKRGWVHGLLAFYLLVFNDPIFSTELLRLSHQPSGAMEKAPHVILIGVDSLRFDELTRLKETNRFPWLAKYLSEASFQGEMVSPLARTHPSLISLLSGRSPQQHGMRQLLEKRAADSDFYLAGGILESFRGRGYRVGVSLSDSDFAYFTPGKYLDEVHQPERGIKNIVLPFVLMDRLLFGWFNNPLGKAILTDVFENSAFAEGYLTQNFSEWTRRQIRRMATTPNPELQLFHSMRLHWPAALQFPARGEKTNGVMAYSNRYASSRFSSISSSQMNANRALYRIASEQNADFFLEPIFKDLYESGQIENSVVVLYSDHGESFFDRGLLPFSKLPRHGASLMFNEDSEYSTLAIHLPKKFGGGELAIPSPMSLTDVLPLVDWVLRGKEVKDFSFRPATSEADRWLMSVGPGQFSDFGSQIEFVAVDETSNPYIWSDFGKLLSKQRAVYDQDGFRLTLFPNYFGYQLILQKRDDPRGNWISVEKRRADLLWKRFQKEFASDFGAGLLPPLQWSEETAKTGFLRWSQTPKELLSQCQVGNRFCEWLIFLRAHHELNGNSDFLTAVSLFSFLRTSVGVSTEVRLRAESQLFRLDALTAGLPSDLRNQLVLSKKIPDPSYKNVAKEWIAHRLLFLLTLRYLPLHEELLAEALRLDPGLYQNFINYWRANGWMLRQGRDSYGLPRVFSNSWRPSAKPLPLEKIGVSLQQLQKGETTSLAPIFDVLDREQHQLLKGVNDPFYLYLWFLPNLRPESRLSLLERLYDDPSVSVETLMLMEREFSFGLAKVHLWKPGLNVVGEVLQEDLSPLQKHQLIVTLFQNILLKRDGSPLSRRLDLREISLKSKNLDWLVSKLQR